MLLISNRFLACADLNATADQQYDALLTSNVAPMYPAFKSESLAELPTDRLRCLPSNGVCLPPARGLGLLPQHPAEEIRLRLQRSQRGDGPRLRLQLRRPLGPPRAAPAVSRSGFCFQLGFDLHSHRTLCSDARRGGTRQRSVLGQLAVREPLSSSHT